MSFTSRHTHARTHSYSEAVNEVATTESHSIWKRGRDHLTRSIRDGRLRVRSGEIKSNEPITVPRLIQPRALFTHGHSFER